MSSGTTTWASSGARSLSLPIASHDRVVVAERVAKRRQRFLAHVTERDGRFGRHARFGEQGRDFGNRGRRGLPENPARLQSAFDPFGFGIWIAKRRLNGGQGPGAECGDFFGRRLHVARVVAVQVVKPFG
jgi:hypothetical protein